MIRSACSAALAALVVSGPAQAQGPDPIAIYAPIRPVTDVYHGVAVSDPYRWMETPADPLVGQWSAAENQRTRDTLDALKVREPIHRDLTRLITAAAPAYFALQAQGPHVFALYSDPARQQAQLVTLNAQADQASRSPLVDPNAIDPKGLTAIDWYQASPDGGRVAVSLSQGGSEDGVLHVYDAASGAEIGEPIPSVQYPTAGGAVAWSRDGKGFWYTRYPGEAAPASERHFNQQLYYHPLGGDWRADPLVLGAHDGLERVSEIRLQTRTERPELLISVQRGDGGQWAFYLLRPGKPPVQIARYEDHIVSATLGPDGAVYAVSRAGAPRGQVVRLKTVKGSAAPDAAANASRLGRLMRDIKARSLREHETALPLSPSALATAPVIVPQSDVAILTGGAEDHRLDLNVDRRHLIVRDIVGGPHQLRVFDLDGKPLFKLPVPAVAASNEFVPLADGSALFSVATYLRAPYFERWIPATGQVSEADLGGQSPIDFSDVEVERVMATSADGTEVPLNIIRRRGLGLTGRTPTLLYGYGGYGISQSPAFLGAMRRLWLDAGGIYVIANIRGGAEFGEDWHSQGALTHKQNVFDDFAAAARFLVSAGYTNPGHLAIMGGSNGGLLMGATLTQHPELAHAVVSSVGIYDMLRVELDPNGAFNVTEFGSVKDPDQFKALYAYSPYQHVQMGVSYPAVLMLTGANDGRVNPMQSRKFTAALQAQSGSGLPILLRTSATSGHGMGSALSERIDQQTDELAFLFDQLAMGYPPGSPPEHPPVVAPSWPAYNPVIRSHIRRHPARPKPAPAAAAGKSASPSN